MTNQRPPTDDLQKGEHDLDVTLPNKNHESPEENFQTSAPPTFRVWWVDSEGSDRETRLTADNEDKARSNISSLENFVYIVSCTKIDRF
jgi:hypothetical protein